MGIVMEIKKDVRGRGCPFTPPQIKAFIALRVKMFNPSKRIHEHLDEYSLRLYYDEVMKLARKRRIYYLDFEEDFEDDLVVLDHVFDFFKMKLRRLKKR